MANDWTTLIESLAKKYKVDPAAALAVASVEGLSGGVGDQGTSYGPFQLHEGGALPQGRNRAWAESPAGIEYAIREIAKVAAGLHGQAAIKNIVTRFERPADPTNEIKNALSAYGKPVGGSSSGRTPGPDPGSGGSIPSPPAFDIKQNALSGLQDIASGQYDPTSVLASLAQAKVAMTPKAPKVAAQPGVAPEPDLATPDVKKWVIKNPGMDRQGTPTKAPVIDFVARVAQLYGAPLAIGTGSNHRQYVAGEHGVVSDHWYGDAADIPASGDALTRLGQEALIAAGMPEKEARKATGGVYNVGGYNILFNTKVGGNHYNHLHVGLGRIIGRPR